MFKAPKPKHLKQDPPNNGQILNKRRRKHIKEGLYTKVSATLYRNDIPYSLLTTSRVMGLGARMAFSYKVFNPSKR